MELKVLLELLEIREGSSIKTAHFIIYFNFKSKKESTLVSNAKIHSFIFDKKIYRIESTNSQTYLRGSISDLNDSQGNMMINCDEFRFLDATITSGDSDSDSHSDLCESLSKIYSKDKIDIHFLFKKTDITKFIVCNLKDLQKACNFPNASIDFTYPIKKFSMEENICALESIPKYFTIDIDCNKNLKYLKNEQLWKSLIKFRFVKLYNQSIGSILIDREGQDLIFKANNSKNKTKISLARKETSNPIGKIIIILRNIDCLYSD